MRRPQVNSEKQDYKNSCHAQGASGAFSRMKRFIAVTMGGQEPTRTIASIKRPCESPSPPTSRSFSNLRAEAETVLGRSLQDLLREDVKNPPQGVPTFVHEICCHMLTHGVDFETLVSEDWCPDRAALLEGLPRSLVVGDFPPERRGELTAVAALFRLFLHELPHPLIGREEAATLSRICKELERYDEGRDLELFQELAMRVRSVLFRSVPSYNLSMLQYLTTFLHQVHTANHNKCPVDQTSLSRLLALVLTEEGMKDETNQSAQRIAEMILLNHTLIFDDSVQYPQDTNYSSDSVSSNCDSRGETTDEADLFTPDDDDVDDDDEDEEEDGNDLRRQNLSTDDAIDDVEDDSTTSTTTDTEEFRSPPVSPIKISGEHQDPGTSSPEKTRKLFLGARCPRKSMPVVCDVTGAALPPPLHSSSPVTPDPKAPPTLFPKLGRADPTTTSPPGPSSRSKSKKNSPFSFENFLKNRPKHWGLGETFLQRKRKGRTDEGFRRHDPKALRSTDEVGDREGFISKLGPYGKDYLPSITGLLTSPYDSWNVDILRSEEDIGSQHKFEPSATESSCISGEEVSELDDESEEDRDADGSDTEGAAPHQSTPCPHEERRSSERYFPRSHHSSSGRKTKRKHRRRHLKDSNSRVQSSEEEEREISSTSVFASLLSGDEPPATFDPTPPESSQSFSALLSSEEPIPSYRSSWGGEVSLHDNWQRTTPHYNREDVDNTMKSVNWYREEDIDLDSYRKSNFGDPSLIGDTLDDVGSRIRGHSAIKLLTKNVNGLKKKIKKFEEEFEKSFGYRPSHADKMKHKDIKKYMSELSKAKKELKQMKEDVPEKKVRNYQKPFPISLLRCQESTNILPVSQNSSSPTLPSKVTKDTYRQVEERLCVKRNEAGRPNKVADLSLEQLKEEKTDIQKALLFYESVHGRPNSREDKELVRPLYDRYRLVKRSVSKLITRPKESIAELPPIIEHVEMDFTLASPQHRGSLKEEDETEEDDLSIAALPLNPDPHPEVVPTSTPEVNLGDLHALPIHELKERKKEAREEKRRLRHSLREYEERFERETGRKMQKEDRGPMEKNYNEYKHVKAKLRLLEALLSKHAS